MKSIWSLAAVCRAPYTQKALPIDDFEFAMNSINWIIDNQIIEKRPVYFACLCDLVGKTVVQCFDVNGKKIAMTGDQAYLLFTFNTGSKYVWMSGL